MESLPALPIPEALTVTATEPVVATPVVLLISGLFAVVAVFALLCKVYAVVTEGHYVCHKDLAGKVIIITGSNTGEFRLWEPFRLGRERVPIFLKRANSAIGVERSCKKSSVALTKPPFA